MLNSKEVIWDGPSIPCLQICKGDTVSDVVYKIAKKVCEITNDLDVQSLDYSCIIDKSIKYGNIDLFLFFTMLLKNDCKIKDLLDAKIDANDTTELLVDNLDLKCFLQPYLDNICAIIRFYNQNGAVINPNDLISTVFQRAEVQQKGFYYVSDIDRSVWIWNGKQYELSNLPVNCVCELEDIELDVKSTLQVIIDNLCQTKTNGVIKACDTFKVVPFDTIDPNTITTIFVGVTKEQSSYYISNITHKLWRWVDAENSYLPSILTTANINLASIDSCLLQAEITLQNWLDQYKVYQEPLITSCLSSTPTIFSNHLTSITDTNICTIQNSVGSAKDVFYAILNGCAKIVNFTGEPNGIDMVFDQPIFNNIEYYYVNKEYDYPFIWNGFQYTPIKEKLINQEGAQWVKLCSLLSRVKNIESTCCTPSCEGIKIKFSPLYNSDDKTFSLSFDTASGTNIPEDFIDCGSILTATDKNGTKVSLDIELVQDTVIELDTSSLDLSSTVNINIKSCLSNGSLTCKTCYSQSLPIIEKCGICKICAVDSSDTGTESVIVYYTLDSSPSTVQNTKLYGGQCLTFKLPEDNPTIKSIITSSSSISLESDPTYPCNDVAIPAAVADTCWFFPLPVSYGFREAINKVNVNGIAIPIGPSVGFGNVDMNLIANDEFCLNYSKLTCYTGTLNLSGKTITVGGTSDFIVIMPKLFTETVDFIIDKKLCGAQTLTWDSSTLQIDASGGTVGTGGANFPTLPGTPPYNVTTHLELPLKFGDVNGVFGIILKLQGQPTNVNNISVPDIELIDPITNSKIFTKGELLSDECECPS